MDLREQLALLYELARGDADLAAHYEAALRHVQSPALARTLTLFGRDHRRHVEDLLARLSTLGIAPGPPPQGASPPVPPPGAGPAAVLAGLSAGEERLRARYAELLEDTWPVELRTLLIHGMADEQRHGAWMRDALHRRSWEEQATGVPPDSTAPVPHHGP